MSWWQNRDDSDLVDGGVAVEECQGRKDCKHLKNELGYDTMLNIKK